MCIVLMPLRLHGDSSKPAIVVYCLSMCRLKQANPFSHQDVAVRIIIRPRVQKLRISHVHLDLIRQVDHDGLGLREHAQRIDGVLAPRSTLLTSTKGCSEEAQGHAIDADHATVDIRRHAHCLVDVLGENACHQAKVGVVGLGDDFLLGLEAVEHRYRTKDLVT